MNEDIQDICAYRNYNEKQQINEEDFFKSLAGIAAVAFAVSCTAPVPKYKMVIVDAPFAMEPIKECVFPEQDFPLWIMVR